MNTIVKQEMPQALPPLVEGHSIYKLIVPEKVEEKIRYLIRKYPNTEWSGVLFCSYEGSFEDRDLVITCQDIYPMDLGSSGWTEFKMSEDVAAYMAENTELLNCDLQLIHSHHHLGAFFSSQDNWTLRQEGNNTNCFVSLIVDTKGTYVARITRKVTSNFEVFTKYIHTSYKFFGEGEKELKPEDTMRISRKEYIEYFNMEVERHEVNDKLSYLDKRFDEIERRKKSSDKRLDNPIFKKQDNSPKESNIFEDNYSSIVREASIDSNEKGAIDNRRIHAAVVSMITCSLTINAERLNLKHWIVEDMIDEYRLAFGDNSIIAARGIISGSFNGWVDFIINYTVERFNYKKSAIEAICKELSKYIKFNDYIKAYYDALSEYLDFD